MRIWVTYTAPDATRDDELDTLAARFGGKDTGERGYSFDTETRESEFKISPLKRAKFEAAATAAGFKVHKGYRRGERPSGCGPRDLGGAP